MSLTGKVFAGHSQKETYEQYHYHKRDQTVPDRERHTDFERQEHP